MIYHKPSNVTVVQPAPASFTCSASGSPRPVLQWWYQSFSGGAAQILSSTLKYSNTSFIEGTQNSSSTLAVNNAGAVDAGLYTCRAVSGTESVSSSASLTVHGEIITYS